MTNDKLATHDRINELKAELAENGSFKRAYAIRKEIAGLKALIKPAKTNIGIKIFSWCLTLWVLNHLCFFTIIVTAI